MDALNGFVMLKDVAVATVKNGVITEANESLLPLYLKRTGNVEGWLASRAIDSHRTNSRLLKKTLRLHSASDAETALFVNAATVTDCYWFKNEGEKSTYENVRFKENPFDRLALYGDPDSFLNKPSKTPELTNIGSFEKCWRLIDGSWWLYKSENENEMFSELFISRLSKKLGFSAAYYELDGDFIRSLDFTKGASVNFEPMSSLTGDNDDYADCFNEIYKISKQAAKEYLALIWTDTVCFNMDRHTENFGFLRDTSSGEIISLAPNFDNNIALISRGYPKDVTRKSDGLIHFFREFVESSPVAFEMYGKLSLPKITREIIKSCLNEIPLPCDDDFITEFILNGQAEIDSILNK